MPNALKGNDRIGLMKLFPTRKHYKSVTDGPTDTRSFRDARMHLKRKKRVRSQLESNQLAKQQAFDCEREKCLDVETGDESLSFLLFPSKGSCNSTQLGNDFRPVSLLAEDLKLSFP